jgi:predicted membrane-bound spermidine synthase
MSRRYLAIYPLFLLSGFCGLIYESIWAAYLKLFLGHAAYAQTVVLVVFIGGMAIGAAACGRFAARIRNPLVMYAAAEFIVGWCAIAFHRVFVAGTEWAYDVLLPATCSADSFCVSSWVFAALLILPQSILLGTTFPLMAAGALRVFRTEPGRRISLLYFLNSFGAVFGVLASTFVLIPTIGLPGASLVAGILNVLLAIAIYGIANPSKVPALAVLEAPARVAPPATPRILLAVALLTGLSSFVYEIVWIRMLSLVLGASTHAFELMLASFILGLALGGAWIRGRIDRLRDAGAFLAGVQIVMGVLALATIPLYDATFEAMAWLMQSLSRNDSGYLLFNVGSSLIASAVMLPVTFMAGMTLPLITLLLFRSGAGEASLGQVYAANTFGSIVGTIAAVHFGLPLLGIKGSLVAGAAVDIALGAWLFLRASQAKPSAAWGWSLAALLLLAVTPFAVDIDPTRKASGVFRYGRPTLPTDARILLDRDGKTSTISVFDRHGVVYISTNGKPDASVAMRTHDGRPAADEDTMVLAGTLPLAYRDDAATAAVIGFGSGVTTTTLLGSPAIKRVDTIEIEPAIIEGAQAFRPHVEPAYSDPRSHIVIDDAKAYFARSREKYDVIVSEPSNPWVSGVSSLYTEEFYRRVGKSLNPGGLFVQWVQHYEFDTRLLASVVNAMNGTFEDYVVYYTAGDLLFVARADGKLPRRSDRVFDLAGVAELASRVGIRNSADLDMHRLAGKGVLSAVLFFEAAPSNSDYEPFVDSNAPRARFRNQSTGLIFALKDSNVPLADFFDPYPRGDAELSRPVDDRNPGAAYQAAQTAKQLRTMMTGAKHDADERHLLPALQIAAFRSVFVDCVSESTAADLWPAVIQLSGTINSALAPSAAEAFWADAERSRCLRAIGPKYRHWTSLLRAVGQRDAVQTERRASALLDEAPASTHEADYLLTAALTGAIASGNGEHARELFTRWMPALSPEQRYQTSFQLLRRISGILEPPATVAAR